VASRCATPCDHLSPRRLTSLTLMCAASPRHRFTPCTGSLGDVCPAPHPHDGHHPLAAAPRLRRLLQALTLRLLERKLVVPVPVGRHGSHSAHACIRGMRFRVHAGGMSWHAVRSVHAHGAATFCAGRASRRWSSSTAVARHGSHSARPPVAYEPLLPLPFTVLHSSHGRDGTALRASSV
jgi:hypothetical protein